MKKKKPLEFFAFMHDFNTKKLIRTNVLAMFQDKKEIKSLIKRRQVSNFEEFKDALRINLMSRYWSRAEYEVLISDLIYNKDRDDEVFKVDVWWQIEPNLDIITRLVQEYHNISFE